MTTSANKTVPAGRQPVVPVDVEIDLATSEPAARAAVELFAQVWPQPDGLLPVTPELAWVLAHSGNYVALARRGDQVIGAALAFRGVDAEGPLLHSHMTGLLPDYQGSSIGLAIKQHQRTWALAQGLDRITWTFDPLVARNAYFNVMKLRATVSRYYRDFYGTLTDGINAGDVSDRCLVTWRVRNEETGIGAAAPVDVESVRAGGALVALDEGPDGHPIVGPVHVAVLAPGSAATLLCRVPSDIVALRRTDPTLAASWRGALRSVLGGSLDAGYQLAAVSRDGWYLLSRP